VEHVKGQPRRETEQQIEAEQAPCRRFRGRVVSERRRVDSKYRGRCIRLDRRCGHAPVPGPAGSCLSGAASARRNKPLIDPFCPDLFAPPPEVRSFREWSPPVKFGESECPLLSILACKLPVSNP